MANKYDKYKDIFKKAIYEEKNKPEQFDLDNCELMPDDDSEFVKSYLKKRKDESTHEDSI